MRIKYPSKNFVEVLNDAIGSDLDFKIIICDPAKKSMLTKILPNLIKDRDEKFSLRTIYETWALREFYAMYGSIILQTDYSVSYQIVEDILEVDFKKKESYFQEVKST